jgi:HlyD family secretion protein
MKMNQMNKLIPPIFAACAVIITVSCSDSNEIQTFETVQVTKKNLNVSILATGIVKPRIGAEVKVGSRVSGVVKHLYVKNGDFVKKGEILAILDDSELSAQFRLQSANLDNARTTLKYALIEMERIKPLAEKSFTSRQTYDNMVKERDLATARLASQQAATDLAATQLGFTRIIAPISGVIGSVSTQEGETVTAAFVSPTFVTIIDVNRIEVRAYVDETDIGKVKAGQEASFTVDTYPGTTFSGIVSAIYPKAEIRDNVVNYIVILSVKDIPDGTQLRPEMTTYCTIVCKQGIRAWSIPNNAIRHRDSETVVYVLEHGQPVKRKISTGLKTTNMIEVLAGLKENEQVIINYE